jgi:hypothetical protein
MTTTFDTLAQGILPATSYYAKGLLAPLLRSMNHILFALAGSYAAPPMLTPDEILNELNEAQAHLDPVHFSHPATLSAEGIASIDRYKTILAETIRLHADEGEPARLGICVAAAASLAADLDWELAGIPRARSDPGSAL